MQKITTLVYFTAFIGTLLFGFDALAQAKSESLPDRPDTQQLLPETTVGLLKLRDIGDFYEKMKNSSGGQMWQSESVKPLVDGIYQSASKQYETVRDQVGLSLEEIRSLPSGEITIALIAPRRKDMAVVVLMETDQENEAVDKALSRFRDVMKQEVEQLDDDMREAINDEFKSEKNEFDITIETMVVDGTPTYVCKHQGLLIGSSSKQELADIFTRWAGEEVKKVRPLDQNRKFLTISKRCAVSNEALPDARFYVDPIGIFKASARGDVGMNFAVALLPTLGLDGVLAAGGNMYIGHENYESISHGHLLLASPKEGVLNALALKPADYTPEPWVPVEIANYMTTSWDIPQMMASIKEISDKIVDGKFDEFFEGIQKEIDKRELDVNLRTDLIDHLSGRMTVVRPILSGTELNGIGNVLSMGLGDTKKFEETLRKFMELEEFSQWWAPQEYGNIKYWAASGDAKERSAERVKRRSERRRKRAEERGRNPDGPSVEIRIPQPAFGVIGDQLVISDSEEFFEMAVDTFNGDQLPLADDEDFHQHVEAMTKLLKSDLPAAVFYFDSVREINFYLKAFSQQSLMDVIDEQAENDESGFLADVKASIDEHGFPAMEEVKQYLSTSGGFITTDDSGYHFLLFQERPSQN